MARLDATDLHLTLGSTPILRGADLSLADGERVLILGPSGAGKSTLLGLLARLREPDRGTILLDGQDIRTLGPPARYRLQHVGQVFQDFHLLPALTVRDNLSMVQAACPASRDLPDLDALLGPLGLIDRLDDRVEHLSRGEQQRVALARAFANAPTLLLADEPTASLDPARRDRTIDHLGALADRFHTAAVVVSHDRALARSPRFGRVLVLDDGRLRPWDVTDTT